MLPSFNQFVSSNHRLIKLYDKSRSFVPVRRHFRRLKTPNITDDQQIELKPLKLSKPKYHTQSHLALARVNGNHISVWQQFAIEITTTLAS